MISILRARQQDLSVLREIAIETQIDTFGAFNTEENMRIYLEEAYSAEQIQKEFHEAGSACFMVWDENVPAGFMRLRESGEVKDKLGSNTVELQRLYVVKSFRGKKVGSALMEAAIKHAQEKGYEWLWLGVWERNFNAMKFYEHWGFERFSEHIFLMGTDPQTDWLLKLKIDP